VVADLKIVEADSKTALVTYNRATKGGGGARTGRESESTDGEANGGQSRKDSQRIQEKGDGAGGAMGHNNTGGGSWKIRNMAK